MIEVEATHITHHLGKDNRLVCELYPGVLVVDGFGPYSVLTYGGNVTRLPANSERTFPIPDRYADQALEMYDAAVEQAESGFDPSPWPPARWVQLNK